MQFFKPENYFEVREALVRAGRGDLIGGCEGLIPANPPKEAIEARRRAANSAARNATTTPSPTRPGARCPASGRPRRSWRTRATARPEVASPPRETRPRPEVGLAVPDVPH